MAGKHPAAKYTPRKETIAKLAKALNVDPEWLRTGKGEPIRVHDAKEADALVIFRRLSPPHRGAWIGTGRLLIAEQH